MKEWLANDRLMLKGVACKSMAHERGYWVGRALDKGRLRLAED